MDDNHLSADDKKFDKLINVVLWFLGAAVLVLIAELSLVSGWNTRGLIGDWAGGHIAAAAAFATAILLIKQVALQRKQLFMQREELSLTREELRRSREVYESQKDQLSRQASISESAAAHTRISQAFGLRLNAITMVEQANFSGVVFSASEYDRMLALYIDPIDEFIQKLLEQPVLDQNEIDQYLRLLKDSKLPRD